MIDWIRLHWKLLLRRFRCIDMFCKQCGRDCWEFAAPNDTCWCAYEWTPFQPYACPWKPTLPDRRRERITDGREGMSRLQQNPWYLPGLSTARIAWPGITASRKLERGAGAKFCTCGKATIVLTTRTTEHGDIWRVRECACGNRHESLEVAIARGNRKEEEA